MKIIISSLCFLLIVVAVGMATKELNPHYKASSKEVREPIIQERVIERIVEKPIEKPVERVVAVKQAVDSPAEQQQSREVPVYTPAPKYPPAYIPPHLGERRPYVAVYRGNRGFRFGNHYRGHHR